jgi:thermitase
MVGLIRRLLILAGGVGVLALLLLGQPRAFTTSAEADIVPGEVLVKFRPGTPAQVVAEVHRQNGGRVKEEIPGIAVQVVLVPPGQERARAAAYARNPNVLFAEPNGIWQAVGFPNDPPNDPRFGDQWGLHNTGQNGGTADADIDAPEAWGISTGSQDIIIAILDTGIDQSHEDLKDKLLADNLNFSGSKTVDDRYGHGTHVAGIAAALTNNDLGVAGTCPACMLLNVKVLNDNGFGSWDAIAKGIVAAADAGAKVINMSLGGYYYSNTVEAAVNYAWGEGAVLVAAAGNDNTDRKLYPAAYEKVIAVGATDNKDQKASFSNYGGWVDIGAPGVSILSTAPDHGNRIWGRGVKYAYGSGTSMATPFVSGVAGLVWARGSCPTNDNGCVRNKIESSADSVGALSNYWTSGRRVNACRAVGGSCPYHPGTP